MDIKKQRESFEEAIVNMSTNISYVREYMFYHRILCNCNVVLDTSLKNIPAGVSVHYNKINLYINPHVFNYKSLENRMAILKHEALHIIHNHFLRATEEHNRNHDLWNISTDCAINQQCNEEHLKGLNGINYKTLKQDLKLEIDVPADLDSESYFELLKQDCEKQGRISEMSSLDGYDDHSSWKRSKGNPELLKDFTKNIIEKAIESTLKAKGDIPSYVTDLLALYSKKKEIDWKKVLRNIVGNKKTSTRTTIQKRNRRLQDRIDLKGKTKDRRFNVLTVVDVSGSVLDEELQNAVGEILHICKLTNSDLDLIQVDSEARAPEKIKSNKKTFNRTGNGGTDLRHAIDKAKEYHLNYDCIVVCTDGYICRDDIDAYFNLKQKVIWLITSKGTINENMNSGRMQAFKLKSLK